MSQVAQMLPSCHRAAPAPWPPRRARRGCEPTKALNSTSYLEAGSPLFLIQPKPWHPPIANLQRDELDKPCLDRASISASRGSSTARLEYAQRLFQVRAPNDSWCSFRTCSP